MREILFRGKRQDNGEWVCGCLGEIKLSRKRKELVIGECSYIGNVALIEKNVVIPETVGRYTGLVDKNGRRIFEGDIVKTPVYRTMYTGGRVYRIAEIAWWDCGFCHVYEYPENVMNVDAVKDAAGVEVIGNIHNSPERFFGHIDGEAL